MGRVGDYVVLETLGEGAYSTVKRVLHNPTGELFVAKIIKKTSRSVQNEVRLEISILRRLRHRNIVQLIEILESDNNYYIILEPVMGGDLCDLIMSSPEPLSEQDVAALFIQLVAGVRTCHRNGVAHRDLKPENLLLTTTGILKISDFGLSRLHHQSYYQALASEYAHTLTGTLAYVAPEVFDGTYDAFRADIWSMGCIAYVLLTQNFPFGSASDPAELERRIRNGEVTPMPEMVSLAARNLCLRLLSPRPENRPTLDQVAQHDFFKANLPLDYLSLTDSRRSLVVQGANAEEFSSAVKEDASSVQCDGSQGGAPDAGALDTTHSGQVNTPPSAGGEEIVPGLDTGGPQSSSPLCGPIGARCACENANDQLPRTALSSPYDNGHQRRTRPFVK